MCVYLYMYTYKYTYTYIYICVYMYRYIYIYNSQLQKVSYVNVPCRMCTCHINDWQIGTLCGLLSVGHVSRANETWRTCEWVMSDLWMSHVSHMWMCHVACIHVIYIIGELALMWTATGRSCLTCEWVMSHMWLSHVWPVNESEDHQVPDYAIAWYLLAIWTQAESIWVERTVHQNIEVIMFWWLPCNLDLFL